MKIITAGANTLVSSTVAASSYSAWNVATAYSIGDKVYLASTFGEYECLVANTGVDPSTSVYNATTNPSGKWLFLGTANRFRMFDQFLNTQTTDSLTMSVEFENYGCMAVYFGNISGDEITIEIIDNNTALVIETYTQVLYQDSVDWLTYFYGSWLTDDRINNVLYERTTLTRDVSIRVTVTGASTVGIGVVVAGPLKDVGVAQWGAQIDGLDYSTVVTDSSNGITYLSKGNFVKLVTADLWCSTAESDAAYNTLSLVSGTICVFYEGLADGSIQKLFGFVKKSSLVYKGYDETLIKVDLQGLV